MSTLFLHGLGQNELNLSLDPLLYDLSLDDGEIACPALVLCGEKDRANKL